MIGESEKKVIFDFSAVDYLDSTGVGIIAICAGKLHHAGGKLRVAGATGIVDQVFRVVRMENIVSVYPTAAAAAENFSAERQADPHA